MRRGPAVPRPGGSLKEAMLQLVLACGGQEQAAEVCRVSASQLHKCTDPHGLHADVFMAADVVRSLEAYCGDPIVTKWNASAAGGVFIPLECDDAEAVPEQLAVAVREHSDMVAATVESLADQTITELEAQKIKREALEAITAVAKLIALVTPIAEGEG